MFISLPFVFAPRDLAWSGETAQIQKSNLISTKANAGHEMAELINQLRSLGFSCSSGQTSGGQVCRGRIDGYPEPIRIFVPISYRGRSGQLLIHFHGNNSSANPRDSSVHFKNGNANFDQWLKDADKEHIIVAPESLGMTATFDEQFNSQDQKRTAQNFHRLVESIETVTAVKFNRIGLSAHSGGYRAIGALALSESSRLDQVNAVGLFDAVYGRTNQITKWYDKMKERDGVFFNIYQEAGTTTTGKPGDQNTLNDRFEKLGITPKPHQVGKKPSKISVLTTRAAHMEALKENRFTDFLRAIDSSR